jgi:hypothetical protein
MAAHSMSVCSFSMSSCAALFNLSNKNSFVGCSSSSLSTEATVALSWRSLLAFSAARVRPVTWQNTLTLSRAATVHSCQPRPLGVGRGASFQCSYIWASNLGSSRNDVLNLKSLSSSESEHLLLNFRDIGW